MLLICLASPQYHIEERKRKTMNLHGYSNEQITTLKILELQFAELLNWLIQLHATGQQNLEQKKIQNYNFNY